MAFHLRADDGPLLVVFGAYISPLIINKKDRQSRVGPPLTKLSGSAACFNILCASVQSIFSSKNALLLANKWGN